AILEFLCSTDATQSRPYLIAAPF
ncbi:MAG: hypothetical protein RI978_593, partial [Verrucomicrobiota bacterium]